MNDLKRISSIALLVSCLGIAPASAEPTETPISPVETDTNGSDIAEDIKNIASYLVGIMDTSGQAATNQKIANVQMTTCTIDVTGDIDDGNPVKDSQKNEQNYSIFLYQEQALVESLDKPYRQRFLQLTAGDRGQSAVESKAYKPIEMEKWVGFCSKPEEERKVIASELGTYLCSVFLKQSAVNYFKPLYVGETQTGGCPTNVRGATSISNTIYLFPDGMNTWDRGFDANGNQVWGAANEAYKFRKRNDGAAP
jgi:hypothetical protein